MPQKLPKQDLKRIEERLEHAVDVPEMYSEIARRRKVHYGARCRGIVAARHGSDEVVGYIALPSALNASVAPHCVHPVLLDSALQLAASALPNLGSTSLPVGLECVEYFKAPGETATVHLAIRAADAGSEKNLLVDVILVTGEGIPTLRVSSLRLRQTSEVALQRVLDGDISRLLYRKIQTREPSSTLTPA